MITDSLRESRGSIDVNDTSGIENTFSSFPGKTPPWTRVTQLHDLPPHRLNTANNSDLITAYVEFTKPMNQPKISITGVVSDTSLILTPKTNSISGTFWRYSFNASDFDNSAIISVSGYDFSGNSYQGNDILEIKKDITPARLDKLELSGPNALHLEFSEPVFSQSSTITLDLTADLFVAYITTIIPSTTENLNILTSDISNTLLYPSLDISNTTLLNSLSDSEDSEGIFFHFHLFRIPFNPRHEKTLAAKMMKM